MEPNGFSGCRGCDISNDLTEAILTERILNLPFFQRFDLSDERRFVWHSKYGRI